LIFFCHKGPFQGLEQKGGQNNVDKNDFNALILLTKYSDLIITTLQSGNLCNLILINYHFENRLRTKKKGLPYIADPLKLL